MERMLNWYSYSRKAAALRCHSKADSKAARFICETRGSILPIFGLTLVALLGSAGMAIDYARMHSVQSHLQSSIDAGVLAAAKGIAQDPQADAKTIFDNYMASRPQLLNGAEIKLTALETGSGRVSANVTVNLPMTFMPIIGFKETLIDIQSTAEYGIGEMEIALALDTTGSMAGTKIAALKTSAHLLLDTLEQGAPSPDKLRVGLVPFAKYVNVGMEHRAASWINVPANHTKTEENCGWNSPIISQSNCRTVNTTCTNDGVSSPCSYETCDYEYGDAVYSCNPYDNEVEWNGCVHSRAHPLNVEDGNYSTPIPGKMESSCSEPVTPLSSELGVVRSAVDAMSADGDTYIPEGLMWGWRLLSPAEPFTESQRSSSKPIRQFLVLMTDGVNSVSPSSSGHHDNDVAYANQLTQESCTNIKADGVTVFTIAFEVADATTKDILRTCASSSSNFFDAANGDNLAEAFQTIGDQLVELRLTN